jgi:hypothetical protein
MLFVGYENMADAFALTVEFVVNVKHRSAGDAEDSTNTFVNKGFDQYAGAGKFHRVRTTAPKKPLDIISAMSADLSAMSENFILLFPIFV